MKVTITRTKTGATLQLESDDGKAFLPEGMLGRLNSMLSKAQQAADYVGTLELKEGKWRTSESYEMFGAQERAR